MGLVETLLAAIYQHLCASGTVSRQLTREAGKGGTLLTRHYLRSALPLEMHLTLDALCTL